MPARRPGGRWRAVPAALLLAAAGAGAQPAAPGGPAAGASAPPAGAAATPAAPATSATPAAPATPATPAAPASAPGADAAGAQRVVVEGRGDDAGSRRRQAIAATQVIGREELEAHGDSSVLDVLQRAPGIDIEGDAPRLRGLGSGYTQILINGEPAPPGFSLDSLAPGEIERIEIVKGPTAEFGGAAGTINVILRQPPRMRQREFRASVGWRAVQPQGSASFSWGERFGPVGLHLPVSAYAWANAAEVEVDRVSRSAAGERTRQRLAGRDAWWGAGLNLAPRLDWKIDDTDSLQLQAFLQRNRGHGEGQRETEALEGPLPSLLRDAWRNGHVWRLARGQAQWQRKAEDGSRLELKASAQASAWLNHNDARGLRPDLSDGTLRRSEADHRERTGTLGLRWRRPLGPAHTLNLGLDADLRERRELNRRFDDGLEQITGSVGVPFQARLKRQVAFMQDEWALAEATALNLGLRIESLDLRVQRLSGGAGSVASRHLEASPVLQLRHELAPGGRQVLRASLARSIRQPELGLLLPRYALNGTYDKDTPNTPIAADSAGQPTLRPETLWALELSLEQQLAADGVFSIGVFHRRVDDLIRRRIALETVPEASVPRWVSRPVNLGRAQSSGLELELKATADRLLAWMGGASQPAEPRRPARGAGASSASPDPSAAAAAPAAQALALAGLMVRGSVSVYRSRVEQIDDPDARLEGQPPWRLTLGFDWRELWPKWSLGASLAVSPGFTTQQTDRQRVWRDGQDRLDAYLLWRPDRSLSLRLAVNHAQGEQTLSQNQIEDLDGFTAASTTRRRLPRQLTAQLQWRF